MPFRRALVAIACVAALALGADLLAPTAVDHASVRLGSAWLVTGNERLATGQDTRAIAVVVSAGATLVVDHATLTLASDLQCAYVAGRVCAQGIVVEPGGTLVLANATLSGTSTDPYRKPVVRVLGTLHARDSAFDLLGGFVVQGPDAVGTFDRVTLRASTGGVTLQRGASGRVADSAFDGAGLLVEDSVSEIARNVVRGAFIGIHVSSSIVGSRCCETGPIIEDNVVEGAVVAYLVNAASDFTLSRNVARGSAFGVNVTALPTPDVPASILPTLEGNVFENVGTGVTLALASSASPLVARQAIPPLVLRGNDFAGACIGVRVDGPSLAADARENWWGSPLGPASEGACRGTVGRVDASRWLTSPPP